ASPGRSDTPRRRRTGSTSSRTATWTATPRSTATTSRAATARRSRRRTGATRSAGYSGCRFRPFTDVGDVGSCSYLVRPLAQRLHDASHHALDTLVWTRVGGWLLDGSGGASRPAPGGALVGSRAARERD